MGFGLATTNSKNTDKEEEKEKIDPCCIVRFRPANGWKGEYGFDWYREGDHEECFNAKNNKSNYDTLVGKYIPNVNYAAIHNTRVQQNDFKSSAAYIPIIGRALDIPFCDYLDRFRKEYDFREFVWNGTKKYYIPTLSLFYNPVGQVNWGPMKACVKMLVENGDSYNIKYTRDPDLTVVSSNKRPEGNYVVADVEITCNLASVNCEQIKKTIEVRAIRKGDQKSKGTLAGLLNVVISRVKSVDICIVIVKIGTSTPPNPTKIEEEKKRIRNALAQANIQATFIDRSLDIDEHQIQDFFINTIGGELLLTRSRSSSKKSPKKLHNVLSELFIKSLHEADTVKENYQGIYKLFFVEEQGGVMMNGRVEGGLGGQASDIGGKEAIIFKHTATIVVPHELSHCLELEHTFENSNTHTLKAKETSNIMDYTQDGFSLWQWQCKKLRNNLKDFSTENFNLANKS